MKAAQFAKMAASMFMAHCLSSCTAIYQFQLLFKKLFEKLYMIKMYTWKAFENIKVRFGFGKTSMKKKRFLSGIARMSGGGLPMPEFLALFQEVHFWSIKRVYFFKNANV